MPGFSRFLTCMVILVGASVQEFSIFRGYTHYTWQLLDVSLYMLKYGISKAAHWGVLALRRIAPDRLKTCARVLPKGSYSATTCALFKMMG